MAKHTNSRLMIDASEDFGGFGASIQSAMGIIEERLDELNNILGGTEDSDDLSVDDIAMSGKLTITEANANAIACGPSGETNPTFKVNSATTSAATGISITGAAAAGGVAVAAISSGTNENLTIDAKGSGTITLGATSTGGITLTRAVSCSSTLASGALTVEVAAVGASGRIAKLSGTSADSNFGDGYGAVEIELTLSGTVAGQTAASSTWINVTGASVDCGTQKICVQDNGIYVTSTGTPMDGATAIIGMRMHYVAEGGGNPGALYCFNTNIYDNVITAIFLVNDKVDLGWVTGLLDGGTMQGHFPLCKDKDGNVHYVNTYTD